MIAPPELTISPSDYGLLTDLYQLTMIACYVGEGIESKKASFELFTRRLPPDFGYLIATGLAQALEYLQQLSFNPEQLEALKKTGIFHHAPPKFWTLLESANFTGDVWAVPEGTAIFPQEPILRIEAPLWQGQLVETYLLNTINYQTLIATRAARMRDVAGSEAKLFEFGTRRAFSPQGSLWAARAAIAGGLNATSNVLAALKLGQKPVGTMAHALVMAINALSGSEDEAFNAFQRYFPDSPLLIDTYDTLTTAQRLAEQIKAGKREITGVRLDSGDLVSLSQKLRSLLPDIEIIASGDLDEWEIAKFKAQGAAIDGYGLGTKLVTGNPVNGIYKLVEIDGIPTMKHSQDKHTYPSCKQIFRTKDSPLNPDRLGLAQETPKENEYPLLELVMAQGKPTKTLDSLETIQKRSLNSVNSLPPTTRQITNPTPLEVTISEQLKSITDKLITLSQDRANSLSVKSFIFPNTP